MLTGSEGSGGRGEERSCKGQGGVDTLRHRVRGFRWVERTSRISLSRRVSVFFFWRNV